MKTVPPLPQEIAAGWFHVTASGEVYISVVARGRDLRGVLGELMFGSKDSDHDELDEIMTQLADPDWWGRYNGYAVQGSVPCGEDPDIEIKRILDDAVTALLEANNFQTQSIFLEPGAPFPR
jgi:hypothetical protein